MYMLTSVTEAFVHVLFRVERQRSVCWLQSGPIIASCEPHNSGVQRPF